MRLNRTRIAVLLAAFATMAGAAAPAASAATHGTPQIPMKTSPAPCSASSVWLKVWGSTGEHCYTGNGSIIVALPGVREAQVLGLHRACLYSPGRVTCVTGPRVVFIIPPIYVRQVTLTTY
jgi:hypothetical protein